MNIDEYPLMLHKPDGTWKIVHSEEEKKAAFAEGWNLKPGPAPEPMRKAAAVEPESPPESVELREPEKPKVSRRRK